MGFGYYHIYQTDITLVHNMIKDGDTESLIRKYLKAGAMTPKGYEETRLGTPQGGNLFPLLSNIDIVNIG